MSKSLRSMTNAEKHVTIQKRLRTSDKDLKGLGYWGAYDSQKFKKKLSSVS